MSKLNIATNFSLPQDTVTSTLLIYGGKGMGKRLAIDTPLATPSGWTTMGAVRVGNLLFDECGQICKVTAISPIALGESYDVHFSDGSVIVADGEHLWTTETYRDRRRGRNGETRTTQEIASTLIVLQGQQVANNHSIRTTQPLFLPEKKLPIDPYVLGVWLGDGSSACSQLTTADVEIVAKLEALGYPTRYQPSSDTGKGAARSYSILGIKPILRELDILNQKRIPIEYLRAAIEQRLCLLQGLMDTDGGWSETDGHTAEFSNTNKELSRGVYELVCSLGMKASWKPRAAKLNGKVVGTDYRVRFTPTLPVFSLLRKARHCDFNCAQQMRRVRRYITAVTPCESVLMRCIKVDSPSQLYLAGTAMIPTHNSNLGAVILEEMSRAGNRWAALDPMGVLYGIRYSADGKGRGVECLILGGPHGDIPLEPTGGAIVADLVSDNDVNVIIDISRKPNGEMWGVGERIRFVTDYGRRLFARQGSLVNGKRREPLFQLIDEAARFMPQMVRSGETDVAKCLSVWATIVEEGRNICLGVGILTQRSARISKDVAELADIMLAFRTVGPNSIAAIMDWLGEHAPKQEINRMISTVRSLPVGSALAVSPGWPKFEGVVCIRPRQTFDSSATPKAGERKRKLSGAGARPDLDKYASLMRETIERAKTEDPKELRKKISERETEVKRAKMAKMTQAAAPTISKRDLKPDPETLERIRQQLIDEISTASHQTIGLFFAKKLRELGMQIENAANSLEDREKWQITKIGSKVNKSVSALRMVENSAPSPRPLPAPSPRRDAEHHSPASRTPERSTAIFEGSTALPKGEKAVLAVLAQHGPSKRLQISVFTGFARSTRDTYLQRLTGKGFVETSGDSASITESGLQALGPFEPLPVGTELREWWLRQLPKGEAAILEYFCRSGEPVTVDRETLTGQTGFARSTRDTYIQRLTQKLLVTSNSTGVIASADLF
jgi:predicted transcriptional regulator